VFRPFNSCEGSEECLQHGESLDRRIRSKLDTSVEAAVRLDNLVSRRDSASTTLNLDGCEYLPKQDLDPLPRKSPGRSGNSSPTGTAATKGGEKREFPLRDEESSPHDLSP
jgi:hypothetical protein